jgi:hypothetical protein
VTKPARTGYTFGGYFDSAGVQYYTPAMASARAWDKPGSGTLYARWTANVYTVVFNAQGGTVSPSSKAVEFDAMLGTLPVPACPGLYFAGWWTGANGTGVRVTRSMHLTATGLTLYAYWVTDPALAQFPYLADPGDDDAPVVTTAYEGFAYDDGGAVRGTVTVSAKAAVKKDRKTGTSTTTWTFTAKAVLQSATVSFSAKTWGGEEGVLRVTAKTGETLEVALGADTFSGTVSGGRAGGTLNVAGARNRFADKKDAAAQARLAAVKGTYNVALVESPSGVSRPSDVLSSGATVAGGTPALPAGYLSLTVGNLGAVKLAGKLPDGTAVSGSAKLLEGLNEDGWYAVPLYKALYVKKGFVGGLLWLNPQDKVIRVDTGCGWFVDWVGTDPKKAPFARELDVCGGWFSGAGLPPGLAFGAAVPDTLPPPAATLAGAWVEAAFPWELPVSASGVKLALPKATAPKKAGTDYDYSGANPSGATLAYTAKTGLFKGAFKLYYDGFDAWGKVLHKSVSVSYTGVLTPVRDAAYAGWPAGLGTGTATINKQKIGIPVRLE